MASLYPYINNKNIETVLRKVELRAWRNMSFGADGNLLEQEVKQEVDSTIATELRAKNQNPEEVLSMKNEREIEQKLSDPKLQPRPWFIDVGCDEFAGPLAPTNNEQLFIQGNTNSLKFENKYDPDPSLTQSKEQTRILRKLKPKTISGKRKGFK